MIEYVKYNCHVMIRNDIGNKTPEMILNAYISNRVDGTDYTFDKIPCIVTSVKYASGRSSIVTKILRKDDYEDLCKK